MSIFENERVYVRHCVTTGYLGTIASASRCTTMQGSAYPTKKPQNLNLFSRHGSDIGEFWGNEFVRAESQNILCI
jgi:hypothetical protein